jgi:hypothetical protein
MIMVRAVRKRSSKKIVISAAKKRGKGSVKPVNGNSNGLKKRAKKNAKFGPVPTIACINKATVDLGVDFDALIAALQKYVDEHFAPVWGTPAKLVQATKPIPKAWTMIFVDDPDRAESLGYHKLTKRGLPVTKVFVARTLSFGEQVSVVASHELAEMLVDPGVNLWVAADDKTLHAYEVCDACEEERFEIDGIAMSDFVYPAFFEAFRKPRSTQFNHLDTIHAPFHIPPGGYSAIRKGDKRTKLFGSKQKEMRFIQEDRRMHRSEYRDALFARSRRTGPAA